MDKFWAGEMLRHVRTLARVSLDDAAAACGVTRGAISQWESGRTIPRLDHLAMLAQLYGLPLDTLLAEIGYPVSAVAGQLREWYQQTAAQSPRQRRHNRVPPFGHRSVKGQIKPAANEDDDPSIAPYAGKHERLFGERIAPRLRQPVYSGT